jgi:hypothetical protein
MPTTRKRRKRGQKDAKLPWWVHEWLTHGRQFSDEMHARRNESRECYEAGLGMMFLDHCYEQPHVADHVITRSTLRAMGYGPQIDSLIEAGLIYPDRAK